MFLLFFNCKAMVLKEIISEKICSEGPITFCDFMDMCLYFPELGYYTSGEARIGEEGDFFTSSSVTNAFGIAIARQMQEMWELMGKGDFTIVEYGAGTGRLCFDIMEWLKENSELFDHLRYCIIERADSCCMHDGAFEGKLHCHKSINDITGEIHCIFSNELIDNLPVHQVIMEDSLSEIYVDYQDQHFKETRKPAGEALKTYFEELGVSLPRGFRTEVNLEALNWLKEAAARIDKGFIITIDYGGSSKELYKKYRSCGTVTCYRKHMVNDDPFTNIGRQDITAHVNFSALDHWGSKEGLNTCVMVSQADFLIASGFRQHLRENSGQQLNGDIFMQAKQEAAVIRTLLLSMGSKFKVLIQSKGISTAFLLQGCSVEETHNLLAPGQEFSI